MAISYPFDLLDGFNGHSVEFDLLWRQEQSRQANGRTIVKDLGSPLWRASYQSAPMYADDLDAWRARLASMENGLRTFYGRPISRLRPIKHPGTDALPSGTIASITDGKMVTLSGFSTIVFSVGDFLCIEGEDLHQIVGIDGGSLEVRPHLWPGVETGDVVTIAKPACIMAIVPGSVSSPADMQSGMGAISFQAIEAR